MDLLAHLEAYVAVADEVSFSRAADRLGIAQPLLSRRVKALEEHFDGRLFDRSHRQIVTTELGALLLPAARDVLDRAAQLDRTARSARESVVQTVGVPADCDPTALARVIRAAAERGTTLRVAERAPLQRAAEVADGSLTSALVRTSPSDAPLQVPLGLAAAPDSGPAPLRRGRGVHLDDLRARRGGAVAGTPILVTAEDRVPEAADRLARAAARAGLPDGLVQPATSTASAVAETLAGRSLLLCAEPFARRNGADWAPLADPTLHRGYALVTTPPGHAAPDWLVALLAAVVGATTTPAPTGGTDNATRLAARG